MLLRDSLPESEEVGQHCVESNRGDSQNQVQSPFHINVIHRPCSPNHFTSNHKALNLRSIVPSLEFDGDRKNKRVTCCIVTIVTESVDQIPVKVNEGSSFFTQQRREVLA